MARGRKPKVQPVKSKSLSPLSSRSPTPPPAAVGADADPVRSEEDKCPSCVDSLKPRLGKEKWIRCDACTTWYHWLCTGNSPGTDVESIDKWFCASCMKADPTRIITMKRKSARKVTHLDYSLVEKGLPSDPNRFLKMMEGKRIAPDTFKRMHGKDVNCQWVEDNDDAMTEPIVILEPEGLGMKMPADGFTVEDVAEMVGEDYPVEVIDVASQSTAPGWNLGRWADYIELEPHAREKIYNVISLEVTGTPLADLILPPRIVRELDWVEKFWPMTRKGKGHVFPKVQLYCLMGVANAWTDWHIDFAGSSVYYHIKHGSKVFYFIRPTQANLKAYEQWSGSEIQNHTWIGDMVDEVIRVELVAGNTMIIPTGWIHAVYTPVDTLVFGGNFIHTYSVPTQLKVRSIEIATQVPRKFRYPQFIKLCWYVGDKYLRDLKAKEEFSPKLLKGVEALAEFLVSEARIMERGLEPARKEAKDQVPQDRVKDPSAVARELRWRARLAGGATSDDEGAGDSAVKTAPTTNGHSNKRKRVEADHEQHQYQSTTFNSNFRNFKPRKWDSVDETTVNTSEDRLNRAKPSDSDENWKTEWVQWKDDGSVEDVGTSSGNAKVDRRTTVVSKVRRTSKGVERQKIERVQEEWEWVDDDVAENVEASTPPTPIQDVVMELEPEQPPVSVAAAEVMEPQPEKLMPSIEAKMDVVAEVARVEEEANGIVDTLQEDKMAVVEEHAVVEPPVLVNGDPPTSTLDTAVVA